MKKKIAALIEHHIFKFFGEERWHVSFQAIVNNDSEMTSNTAMLIEGLNTILSTVIHGNIINLYMLKIRFIVNIGVIIRNDRLIIFEPFYNRPWIANNTTGQLDRLANLEPSVARSIYHEWGKRGMNKSLPPVNQMLLNDL